MGDTDIGDTMYVPDKRWSGPIIDVTDLLGPAGGRMLTIRGPGEEIALIHEEALHTRSKKVNKINKMAEITVEITPKIDEKAFAIAEERLRVLRGKRGGILTSIKRIFQTPDYQIYELLDAHSETILKMADQDIELGRRVSALENEIEKLKEGEQDEL